MWFKRPAFWQKRNALTLMLQPFACIYRAASALRYRMVAPVKVSVPVICIGNITVGGAGKTPVAITIAQYLQQQRKKPVFLTRGYGGTVQGPVQVDPALHQAKDVGDEPLLLCRTAPCFVAKDRVASANAAIAAGADIVVMDDGFQNPFLEKDLSLLVIDGSYGFGNGLLLPAGPLREPCAHAITRASACIVLGEYSEDIQRQIPSHLPVLTAQLTPKPETEMAGKTYVAFAGIGNPEKFFATLASLNVTVAATHAYPDHYPYQEKDLQQLAESAQKHQAELITTEKDWVRLPASWQQRMTYLPVTVTWDEPEMLGILLEKFFPRTNFRPTPGSGYTRGAGFPPMPE